MRENVNWVLVTGATRGIGKAILNRLSKDNHLRFILLTRSSIKISEFVSENDQESFYIEADLNDLNSIANIFNILNKKEIKVQSFIHCAGLSPLMAINDLDINFMLNAYNVNYFSFMVIMKYLANPLYALDGCKVIAMSSITTSRRGRRQSIYASSKAALEHSIHYLANELLNRKFSIVGLSLGVVDTEMFENLCESSDNLWDKTLDKQPFGVLQPEQISEYVWNLMSTNVLQLTTGTVFELNCGYLF